MKIIKVLIIVLGIMNLQSSFTIARDQAYVFVCAGCGVVLDGAQLLYAVRVSQGEKVLCSRCVKRMKEKHEGTSTSPKTPASTVSFSGDSVFSPASPPPSSTSSSPVSPLMVPVYQKVPQKKPLAHRSVSAPVDDVMTPEMAAQIGAFLADKRKAKNPSMYNERDLFESEASDTKGLNMMRLFERLYSKRISDTELAKKSYVSDLHSVSRRCDVTGPQGEHLFLDLPKKMIPFLWQQGGRGVFLYADSDGMTIRDFEKNCTHQFPLEVVPYGVLGKVCTELGFDRVEPLSPYKEAERAYQASVAVFSSPTFK